MRDEDLRDLERAWLATRDPELEQTYLQALLRRGLPRPRLLLAAYLGVDAALEFLGDEGFPEEPDTAAWVRGLGHGRLARSSDLARESLVRALLAAWALEVQSAEAAAPEVLAAQAAGLAWLRDRAQAREALAELREQSTPGDALRRVALSPQLRRAGSAAAEGVRQSAARLRAAQGRSVRAPLRSAIFTGLVGWTLASVGWEPA